MLHLCYITCIYTATFKAAMKIHGGTKSNKRPALGGLYHTIAKKCKTSVLGDCALSNSKVTNYTMKKCKPKGLAVFECSKDVLHSIATTILRGNGEMKIPSCQTGILNEIQQYKEGG